MSERTVKLTTTKNNNPAIWEKGGNYEDHSGYSFLVVGELGNKLRPLIKHVILKNQSNHVLFWAREGLVIIEYDYDSVTGREDLVCSSIADITQQYTEDRLYKYVYEGMDPDHYKKKFNVPEEAVLKTVRGRQRWEWFGESRRRFIATLERIEDPARIFDKAIRTAKYKARHDYKVVYCLDKKRRDDEVR